MSVSIMWISLMEQLRRRGSTQASTQTRKAIISRFRESKGFNVLVLSPDVAGIGLTLVEANHVIHYGRWWNPARESQATDRVYCIGQERDVHIYYPIAIDPEKAFETFDEKLHKLIFRRRDMAAEFLAPMLTEDALGQELLKDILETATTHLVSPTVPHFPGMMSVASPGINLRHLLRSSKKGRDHEPF